MGRSGLWSQIGYAAETTWATYAAPTRFLEFNEEDLKLEIEYIQSESLRAGNRVLRSDREVDNKTGVGGSVTHEVQTKGFGLLFKHWLGTVAISTPGGATATRRHTHTIGDPYGLGLTVQVGRPDTANTVQPFSYLGCKITEAELSQELDGLLMFNATLDGQDETTAQSLGVASFPTGSLFDYSQCTVTVAGSSLDVTKASVKVGQGLNTERRFVRSSTLKKEQIAHEMMELSGELAGEFESLTAYNRFVDRTVVEVVYTWTGAVIEGSFTYKLTATMPACRFSGETPVVGGPGILEQPLPFDILNNGTDEPLTLVLDTTDTTS